MAINPFFNTEHRLRNGWWIALFFLLMAAMLVPAVALVAGGALIEELMFRSFVFQCIIDGLGEWPAQLILGGLFLLTHADTMHVAGGQRFMASATIFLASVMFGLAFIRTRSLAMPLGLHIAANFVQGSVLGFGVSGNDQPSLAIPVFGSSPSWLTGSVFGLEASAPGLVSVIVSVIILLRWKPADRSASPILGAK